MDKCLLENLAKRIKELRKIHKMTQDDLSYKSGIARSTIGNIETAQNDVTLSKVNNISKAFEMTLSEFLNF
jgi:putative transcriptional regulator